MPMRLSPCMVKGDVPTLAGRQFGPAATPTVYQRMGGHLLQPVRSQSVLSQPSPGRGSSALFHIAGLHLLAGSSRSVASDQFDCLICFVDNTAAEHALNKGTSKNAALCWLLGSFWLWAAKRGLFVTFQRVTSQANLSDKVSRGDFSEASNSGASDGSHRSTGHGQTFYDPSKLRSPPVRGTPKQSSTACST